MKNLTFFLVVLIFFAACSYSPSSIRYKYAKKYRSKTTGARSRKMKNRSVPYHVTDSTKNHRPNSMVASNKNKGAREANWIKAVTVQDNVSPWIRDYTVANGLPYPRYFIMRASEIQAFLSTDPKPNTGYLHFYLTIDNQTSSLDLVLTGATDNGQNSHYSYTDVAPLPNTVFSNFMTAPNYGVVQDAYLEGGNNIYQYPSPPNLITTISPTMSISQAAINITDYQQLYDQFALAYSFMIDTTNIGTFLNNPQNQIVYGAQKPPAQNVVQYIQVYLAYEQSNPDITTIILVGLDANGNHVYFTNDAGNSLFVFNAAVPCPFCNVDESILLSTPNAHRSISGVSVLHIPTDPAYMCHNWLQKCSMPV